jgi:hypothetical protein
MTPTGFEPVTYGLGSRTGSPEGDSLLGGIRREPAESDPLRHKGATTAPAPRINLLSYAATSVGDAKLPPRRRLVVYFLRDRSGLTKVGRTEDMEQRLRVLRKATGRDVRLVAWIAVGSTKCETYLHRLMREHGVGGEWFRPNEFLRSFLAIITTPGFTPRQRRERFDALAWNHEHQRRTSSDPALSATVWPNDLATYANIRHGCSYLSEAVGHG